MRKLLLATSAIAVMSGLGASAYVRDGVVDAGKTNVELFITGEVSAYMGITSITAENKDSSADPILEETFIGQDYSGDVDFIAKVHTRGWDIEGRVEVDFGSKGEAALDEAYIDFANPAYGMFRVGRGPAPSDMLSLDAALPGENWDDLSVVQSDFGIAFQGLGNSRFADDANQIGYYTPKFGNMFQFGMAYIFNDGQEDVEAGNVGALNQDSLANTGADDAVEFAAKYHTEMAGYNIGVSGAYRHYFYSNPTMGAITMNDKESAWTVGMLVGYMGFNWTTTYGRTDYDSFANDWGIRTAVTYAWDKWEAGVAYEVGQAGAGEDNTITSDLIEAGLSYQSFPGLKWHGAVAYAASGADELSATPNAEVSGLQFRTGVDLSW